VVNLLPARPALLAIQIGTESHHDFKLVDFFKLVKVHGWPGTGLSHRSSMLTSLGAFKWLGNFSQSNNVK